MPTVETLRHLSEVWKLFGDMPDETTLGVDLAALYLGISVKTLARYRQSGSGPQYIQYQSEDSKARNQRVNYLLKDLRSWRDNHKVSNTMHAAQVRGLAFSSLADLTISQPFWIVKPSSGVKIISHVLTVSDEEFKNMLLDYDADIAWLTVEEALFRDWQSANERNQWNDLFIDILSILISASKAAQDKHCLNLLLNR